jgi:hypothetical protein
MPETLGPLNKCPKCETEPIIVETTISDDGASIGAVACYECKIVATAATTQQAIVIWNTLTPRDT